MKIYRRLTKAVAAIPLALLAQASFHPAQAGASWSCRNSCWGNPAWKYKANAHVQQKQGLFWSTKVSKEAKNCTNASTNANFGSAFGLAWARPGSHGAQTGSNLSHQRGGPGFSGHTADNSVSGYAYSSMETTVVIDDSNLVSLSNITGEFTAGPDGFGAAWTVAIWLSPTPDELLDPKKVLLQGSAWIENGQLRTTGFFNESDFTAIRSSVTNEQTEEQIPVIRYVPVAGLKKSLQLPRDIVSDHIVVSGFGESGYGKYDEAAVLTEEPFLLVEPTAECVAPPPGMVAWWSLDETNGATTYADLSGTGNAALVEPGPVGSGVVPPATGLSPTAVAGKVAGAGYFAGGRGRALNAPSLNFGTGSFSVDGWVKPVPWGSDSPIVNKLDKPSATQAKGYEVLIFNGIPMLRLGDGTLSTYTSVTPVNVQQWNFIAVSVDRTAKTVTFHVNGVTEPAQTLTVTGNIDSAKDVLLGASHSWATADNPSNPGEIALDEIELFKRALTTAEMSSLWSAGSAGKCKTACGTNLLINPSFEDGPFTDNGDGCETLLLNATSMTGWKVVADQIARCGTPNTPGITASHGKRFLDLSGYDNNVPHGGVEQTVATQIGQVYQLSFDLGVVQGNPELAGPIAVKATVTGSPAQTFTHNPAGVGVQWASYGFSFTATSASTTVTLEGISSATFYIGLDNISLFEKCCVTPPTGLVAWWPLDEGVGATTYQAQVGPNALIQPGPLDVPGVLEAVPNGKVAGASWFLFPNAHGRAANGGALNFDTNSFSVDCWFRFFGGLNSHYLAIVDKFDASPSGKGYSLGINLGQLQLRLGDGTSTTTYNGPVVPSLGPNSPWIFIGVAVDRTANQVRFHVDGTVQTQTLSPVGNTDNTLDLLIGGYHVPPSPNTTEHQLDEVELFNRALTAAEFELIRNADKYGKCKTTQPGCVDCPPVKQTVVGCPPVMPNFTNLSYCPINGQTGPLTAIQNIPAGTALPAGPTSVIITVCDAAGKCRKCELIIDASFTPGCGPNLPVITQQPKSLTLEEGRATFSVAATGESLTYQWLFRAEGIGEMKPIPNATQATLVIANVQPKDVGSYQVVVSNPSGSTTSEAVDLAINCKATVVNLSCIDNTSLTANCTVSISLTSVSPSNPGGSTYGPFEAFPNPGIPGSYFTRFCGLFNTPGSAAFQDPNQSWFFVVTASCCPGKTWKIPTQADNTNSSGPLALTCESCCNSSPLPVIDCSAVTPKTEVGCIGFVPDYRNQVTVTPSVCFPNGPTTITQTPSPGTAVTPGVKTVTIKACHTPSNCTSCTTTYTLTAPPNKPCDCGVPPPTGMVLWLPFDEPRVKLGIAHNVAGGNHGNYHNQPIPTLGYVDRSLCFNGVNQYVKVPYYSATDIGAGSFTIDAWVKRGAGDTGKRRIVDHQGFVFDQFGAGMRGYSLYLENGVPTIEILGPTATVTQTGPVVPADGQWHFVAVSVYRNPEIAGGPAVLARLFMDATITNFNPTPANGSLTNGAGVSIGALSIGGPVPPAEFFSGCIDEVEIFNRPLSTQEIAAIRLAGPLGKCKHAISIPNVAFCQGQQTATLTATIRNNSAYAETYTYGATPCNLVSSGLVFGGVPATTVLVPPWTSKIVTFTTTAPAAYPGCLKLLALANTVGALVQSQTVWLYQGNCFDPNNVEDWGTKLVIPQTRNAEWGRFTSGPFKISNPSATEPLSYRLRAVGPDGLETDNIKINGLPPGTIIPSARPLAPGETATIEFTGQVISESPNDTLHVVIESPIPGSEEWAMMGDFPITATYLPRVEIMEETEAGLRQYVVTWSGQGILQSAPNLAGPWTDIPGAENPYPMPTDIPGIRPCFFRLKNHYEPK